MGLRETLRSILRPGYRSVLGIRVHHSLRYASWKQRKEVAGDLRLIYSVATLSEAE